MYFKSRASLRVHVREILLYSRNFTIFRDVPHNNVQAETRNRHTLFLNYHEQLINLTLILIGDHNRRLKCFWTKEWIK